jgi:hypothetical protein
MTKRQPDISHITMLPVLGILATTNITLDSLIGGLQDHYPEILDNPTHHVDSREAHHNARVAIALAQALQAVVSCICTQELEIVDPIDDGYF